MCALRNIKSLRVLNCHICDEYELYNLSKCELLEEIKCNIDSNIIQMLIDPKFNYENLYEYYDELQDKMYMFEKVRRHIEEYKLSIEIYNA